MGRRTVAAMQRRAVVRSRGHPHIRASHAKTLEFTREPAVTSRATCVAGVAAELDQDAVALLRGRVVLTVRAAGFEVSGEALINPGHQVADRLIIRRSYHADADTLAVGSTLAAGDLGPAVAALLTQTATAVTLTIAEAEPPPPLLILRWAGEPYPVRRLGVLWRHADETVDLATARACGEALRALGRGASVAATVPGRRGTVPRAVADWLATVSRGSAESAAAADGGRPRLAVTGWADWQPEALLAAGLPATPALWLGCLDGPAIRSEETLRLLRDARVPAVLRAPAGEAAAALEGLAALAPEREVAVPDGALDVGTAMIWTTAVRAAAAVRESAAQDITVVTAARPADREWVDLDAVARALAAAGVKPRTLSDALRPFGLSRRRLYATLGGLPGASAGGASAGGASAGGASAGGPSAGGPSAGGPSAGGPSAGGPSAA